MFVWISIVAFRFAGIGSALLGRLDDHTSIRTAFDVCTWMPLLGLLTGLLPEVERPRQSKTLSRCQLAPR